MMPDPDGLRGKARRLMDGDSRKHIDIKRHRARFILCAGIVILFAMFLLSISVGPTGVQNPVEALMNLWSAISKGGEGLTPEELAAYSSRLPRTVAAIGVGVGLAVAGSAYQAVIRNPLVDPYIMGVSSGAGTMAVAVIAFDFTFFGLFSPHSIYLTAASAIVGGLVAFGTTMLLAQRAGGTTNSYVLSGVVVGLVFSAVQTVMIVFSGDRISSALMWLFGSFASISLVEAFSVLIPALVLSIIVLRYAKELNLVLLGEDQARQMGLDVRRFNALILILASVLASVCVAFVGIIGFVGLVIPHFCRMLFGGDHRLVLPASMAFGGCLMIFADLLSRMIVLGIELPVGAITTLIGVPVFAYLLIRKGRIYNG